jgi:uncharacterized protein YxjI
LRVQDTLVFKDMQGNKLCQIREKLLRVKDTLEIEGADGRTLAMVKKALITPVRDRWTVKIKDGVEVAEGQDDVVTLAVTVAIDAVAHPTW